MENLIRGSVLIPAPQFGSVDLSRAIVVAWVRIGGRMKLGNEGLLSDLKGLRDEYDAGRSHDPPYSTQALLGQFKGEQHRRQHLMYSVDVTSSGIEVRKAISDLILMRQHQNLTCGPVICDKEDSQWTTVMANEILHELLCRLFNQDSSMFPSLIGSHEDILSFFLIGEFPAILARFSSSFYL
jgi:hypothetical protein